jgi:hypothetical protein
MVNVASLVHRFKPFYNWKLRSNSQPNPQRVLRIQTTSPPLPGFGPVPPWYRGNAAQTEPIGEK